MRRPTPALCDYMRAAFKSGMTPEYASVMDILILSEVLTTSSGRLGDVVGRVGDGVHSGLLALGANILMAACVKVVE